MGGFTPGFGGSSPAPSGKHGHGDPITGFLKNLGGDIRDAVVGLPTGAAMLAEHPVKTTEMMGRQTWQTWSPLFHGHIAKFAHQTYDHPLAPLLDAATVFTAGAGLAAKVGATAAEAGVISKTSKLAELSKPTTRVVRDVAAKDTGRVARPDFIKVYHQSPAAKIRHGMAMRFMRTLEPHMPSWFTEHAREARLYDRMHHSEIQHRVAATNVQVNALMRAGKTVSDPSMQHIIQPEILAHNYWNLRRHAFVHPLDQRLPEGYRWVRELTHQNQHTLFAAKEDMPLESRLQTFGKDMTSKKVKDAARAPGQANTHGLIVPLHDARNLGIEGSNSTKLLRQLYHKPTVLWKRINVGYAPRVITNNAVGNWLMYGMRTAGEGGARGFVDAVRFAHGEKRALKAFKEMHRSIAETQGPEAAAKFAAQAHPTFAPHWARQYFGNELGNVFGNVLNDGKNSKLKQGLYPIVHRVADQPVRVAALSQFMRKAPEVKALMKGGKSFDEAAQEVLRRNRNNIRERAVEHIRSIAGDYTAVHPGEKLMSDLIPFYLWDKHIVKHFGNMVTDKPGRVAAMQQVSLLGSKKAKEMLGTLPSFMQTALPLEMFGLKGHNGRTPLLMTTGMNPYSTVGELADFARGLTTGGPANPGESVASQINPLLTAAIEQISGHKLGTQAPPPQHGGVIPSVLVNAAEGTSYGQLIQRLAQQASGNVPQPKHPNQPFLYERTPEETMLGLLGFPRKNVSLTRAQQMADQENHVKKGRHGGGNPFTAGL